MIFNTKLDYKNEGEICSWWMEMKVNLKKLKYLKYKKRLKRDTLEKVAFNKKSIICQKLQPATKKRIVKMTACHLIFHECYTLTTSLQEIIKLKVFKIWF